MSGRTVYFDAEEGEDSHSDADSVDSEISRPSVWDVLSSALLPKRPTRTESHSTSRDQELATTSGGSQPGCLPLFSTSLQSGSPSVSPEHYPPNYKPDFGASSRRAEPDLSGSIDGIECWEEADATSFMVRGLHYARTKKKEPCAGCFYRLTGTDIYSFDQKIDHIARHVRLPDAPRLGPGALQGPHEDQIPPILIINVQLPTYSPALFGGRTDGKGQSLVYYFTLPEGWEPDHVQNKNALHLLERFMADGHEADGTATRERLKLIARVANKEEWAKAAPLSGAEYRLLSNYNDKPLLTRPQQRFFRGDNYLEIDVDVHCYAYLARKAFSGFIPRLATVVFENAFIIQGNNNDELPELMLACARVSRVDFNKVRPFPGHMRRTLSRRMTLETDRTDSGTLVTHTRPLSDHGSPPG